MLVVRILIAYVAVLTGLVCLDQSDNSNRWILVTIQREMRAVNHPRLPPQLGDHGPPPELVYPITIATFLLVLPFALQQIYSRWHITRNWGLDAAAAWAGAVFGHFCMFPWLLRHLLLPFTHFPIIGPVFTLHAETVLLSALAAALLWGLSPRLIPKK